MALKEPVRAPRAGPPHELSSATRQAAPVHRARVLVAPDKFKGSLSAADVAAALAQGLRRVRADVKVVGARRRRRRRDVAAAVAAGFEPVAGRVGSHRPARATAYAPRDGAAVVEMAAAAGSPFCPAGSPLRSRRPARPRRADRGGAGRRVPRRSCSASAAAPCTDGGAAWSRRSVPGSDATARLPPGGAALARSTLDLAGLDPPARRRRASSWPATWTTR